MKNNHLLTTATTIDFLKIKYSVPHNQTGFESGVENERVFY